MQRSQTKVLDGSSVKDCLRPRRLVGAGTEFEGVSASSEDAFEFEGAGDACSICSSLEAVWLLSTAAVFMIGCEDDVFLWLLLFLFWRLSLWASSSASTLEGGLRRVKVIESCLSRLQSSSPMKLPCPSETTEDPVHARGRETFSTRTRLLKSSSDSKPKSSSKGGKLWVMTWLKSKVGRERTKVSIGPCSGHLISSSPMLDVISEASVGFEMADTVKFRGSQKSTSLPEVTDLA